MPHLTQRRGKIDLTQRHPRKSKSPKLRNIIRKNDATNVQIVTGSIPISINKSSFGDLVVLNLRILQIDDSQISILCATNYSFEIGSTDGTMHHQRIYGVPLVAQNLLQLTIPAHPRIEETLLTPYLRRTDQPQKEQ